MCYDPILPPSAKVWIKRIWAVIRYFLSTVVLFGALLVVIQAIVNEKTQFWESVPWQAVLCLLFVLLAALALAEGSQIAVVELMKASPEAYKQSHPSAYAVAKLTHHKRNVERYLMGRQVIVVLVVFFLAKMTTLKADHRVPGWLNVMFLETGLLGAVVVVLLAQLPSQIFAAQKPITFISIPGMKWFIYACLGVEWTGLTHAAWLIPMVAMKLVALLTKLCCCGTAPPAAATPSGVDLVQEGTDSEPTIRTMLLDPESVYTIPFPRAAVALLNGMEEDITGVLAEASYAKHFRLFRLMRPAHGEPGKKEEKGTNEGIIARVSSHENFYNMPSQFGSVQYASPGEISTHLESFGLRVPRFLLPVGDPNHIPPHIVACRLLATVDLLLHLKGLELPQHLETNSTIPLEHV